MVEAHGISIHFFFEVHSKPGACVGFFFELCVIFAQIPWMAIPLIRQVYKRLVSHNFDFKNGVIGAIFMGFVVFCINYSHGTDKAAMAAAKQFVYTLFFGSFFLRLIQKLSTRFANRYFSLFMAVLIPSAVAIGATYLVHVFHLMDSFMKTPEPFLSTLPVMFTAPPTAIVWGIMHRRRMEKAGMKTSMEAGVGVG